MATPQLSVIIPVYNAEQYISNTLSGLLGQSFADFEVICVNDCSTDHSLQIVQEFAQKDSRVKYIDLEKNSGPSRARNYAIDVATGVYITFLDADDQIDPDLYEQAMKMAMETEADQVVWGATEEHFDNNNRHVKSIPIVPERRICENREQIVSAAISLEEKTLFGYLWNSLYKNEIVQSNAIRIKETSLYEDYFFNLDFIRKTEKLAILDHGGYHYFKRMNGSVTHRFHSGYFNLSYERVASFWGYCEENAMITEDTVQMLGNKLLRYTLSALARNNNPKSQMDFASRKQWIKENIYPAPMYHKVLAKPFKTNPVFAFLRQAIRSQWTCCCLLLGKLVYTVRKA